MPLTFESPALFGGASRPQTVRVLPEHEAELREYLDLAARYGRAMVVGILALTAATVVVGIAAAVLQWPDGLVAVVLGALVAGMGLLLVLFPFVTPQTIQAFGVRSSVRIGRVLGWITIALGAGIAFLG